MATAALEALKERMKDAERLIEIHELTTGQQAGRRYNFDALNRSAVLLSIAAWEGFVEDLLKYSVEFMATRLDSPADLPKPVREVMLQAIYEDLRAELKPVKVKNGIWALVGSGWRAQFIQYGANRITRLNKPSVDNVQQLFKTVVGLNDFAAGWGARRWGRQAYVDKLGASLLLRHRIAHGAIGSETVGKQRARAAVSVVTKAASWTSSTVSTHLHSLELRSKPLKNDEIREALKKLSQP